MGDLISIAEVRSISGADSNLVSDTDILTTIEIVEEKTKNMFDIEFTPTVKVETLTGEWKDRILVDEFWPLTVYELRNGETVLDAENIYVHTEKGFIELYGETVTSYYTRLGRFSGWDLDVKIKYLYGMIEKVQAKQTETDTAATAGTSVVLSVLNSSKFNIDDWVYIEDLNRQKEVAKITDVPDGTSITVERLVNSYESGALVTNTKTHDLLKQYILYET